MLKNYIKITLRSLFKNIAYTSVNITGLTLGIGFTLIIFLLVRFELSFDTHHKNANNIYRLVKTSEANGETNSDPGMPYPLRLSFENEFPEAKDFAFVDNNIGEPLIYLGEGDSQKSFQEESNVPAFVSKDFFKLFNYEFLYGNQDKLYPDDYSVVITRSLAEKYFGDYRQAGGKVLMYDGEHAITITGVVEDPPMNTDLPFKMFISLELGNIQGRFWDGWNSSSSSVQAFIRVGDKENITALNERLNNYIDKHFDEDVNEEVALSLQPLSEMHFDEQYANFSRMFNMRAIYALLVIAAFLIITASINFVNLNTAQIVKRTKEIGVRKVLGSNKSQLIIQFIGETAIVTLISIVLSLGLVEGLLLYIHELLGYNLPSTYFNFSFVMVLTTLFVLVSALAGFYPAFVLSRFQPIKALKEKLNSSHSSGFSLKKSLIIVQLFISQLLIIAVLVISKQINFFINNTSGFDREGVIEFDIPDPEGVNLSTLVNELNQVQGVSDVALSNTGVTSDNRWGGTLVYTNENEVIQHDTQVKIIDDQYLSTYGLTLLEGTNIPEDTLRKIIVNRSFVKAMGLESIDQAIGEEVTIWRGVGTIVGVVEDFNSTSMHNAIGPVAMWEDNRWKFQGAVKVENVTDWQTSIDEVQKIWTQYFPNNIFTSSFLDDNIRLMYENEQRLSNLFKVFTVIAIAIGSIGLFGLISFMAANRTKEIGVRKVLGASVNQMMMMLSKDFVVLAIIAFALAAPVAWYFLDNVLSNFAYRIDIDWWIFSLAILISLIITLLTVGFRSFKSAVSNPVNALRDE